MSGPDERCPACGELPWICTCEPPAPPAPAAPSGLWLSTKDPAAPSGLWLSTKDPAAVVAAMDAWRELPEEHPARAYTGDPAFGVWLYYVNRRVMRRAGVSFADLGDAPWRDYHDDGLAPREALELAIDDGWLEELGWMEGE